MHRSARTQNDTRRTDAWTTCTKTPCFSHSVLRPFCILLVVTAITFLWQKTLRRCFSIQFCIFSSTALHAELRKSGSSLWFPLGCVTTFSNRYAFYCVTYWQILYWALTFCMNLKKTWASRTDDCILQGAKTIISRLLERRRWIETRKGSELKTKNKPVGLPVATIDPACRNNVATIVYVRLVIKT